MSSIEQRWEYFSQVLRRFGYQPCLLQLDVAVTCQLVAALQLALRHPSIEPNGQMEVREFVRDTIAQLDELDAAFGNWLNLGNDPENDMFGGRPRG